MFTITPENQIAVNSWNLKIEKENINILTDSKQNNPFANRQSVNSKANSNLNSKNDITKSQNFCSGRR